MGSREYVIAKRIELIEQSCWQPPVSWFDLGRFQVPANANRRVKLFFMQMKVTNKSVKILCGESK